MKRLSQIMMAIGCLILLSVAGTDDMMGAGAFYPVEKVMIHGFIGLVLMGAGLSIYYLKNIEED